MEGWMKKSIASKICVTPEFFSLTFISYKFNCKQYLKAPTKTHLEKSKQTPSRLDKPQMRCQDSHHSQPAEPSTKHTFPPGCREVPGKKQLQPALKQLLKAIGCLSKRHSPRVNSCSSAPNGRWLFHCLYYSQFCNSVAAVSAGDFCIKLILYYCLIFGQLLSLLVNF